MRWDVSSWGMGKVNSHDSQTQHYQRPSLSGTVVPIQVEQALMVLPLQVSLGSESPQAMMISHGSVHREKLLKSLY